MKLLKHQTAGDFITLLFTLIFLLCIDSKLALAQTSSPPQGQSTTPDSANVVPTHKPKWFEFEGTLRQDNDLNPDESGKHKDNLRFQRFETQATVNLRAFIPSKVAGNFQFVIRTKMERDVIINGKPDANDLDIQDYIKEFYFLITGIGGAPVDLSFGCTEVAYGQDFQGTMDFQNDAAHRMTDPDQGQGTGATVTIRKDVYGIFNKFEGNVFTSNPRLLKSSLSRFDGLAFRVTNEFSDYLVIEISLLKKGNAYDPELKPETKVSFGGVYRKKLWTYFGEGVKMHDSPIYPDAKWGATAGVNRVINGLGKLNFEFTGIQSTLKQYVAGVEVNFGPKWTAGPTYRYTKCVGGNEGCVAVRGYGQGSSLGFAFRYRFGGGAENQNSTWIGKKAPAAIKKIYGGALRRYSN
jgi:hypothetical protein